MGRATLVELLHIAAGLAAAAALTSAVVWAYPLGRVAIWCCGAAAMVAVAVMGLAPLNRARAADRQRQ